ncbi:MAG: hypothetical protein IH859_03605, partial [Chloroflexi bacterium]|nr:hypothetical protein [Chloroflexota bacterium]
IFGLVPLMIAVSVRAGAFFVFPMLALWSGWVLRGKKRFNFSAASVVTAAIGASYLSVNTIYNRLVSPGNSAFGNFAYTLYGQVRGGVGWHRAIEDLGTRDSSLVYRAVVESFLEDPFGFFSASVKSYQHFFLPGWMGIFSFQSFNGTNQLEIVFWMLGLILLIVGIIWSLKKYMSPTHSLLIAVFIGILLSIPFLPPIDGGRRFYASTMPFFFALIAVGINAFSAPRTENADRNDSRFIKVTRSITLALSLMTVVFPIFIQRLSNPPQVAAVFCPVGQIPFALEINAGSYIDLIPKNKAACGMAPNICLEDFKENGVEKNIDPFFNKIVKQAEEFGTSTRLVPSYDLISGNLHFFIGTSKQLDTNFSTGRIVTGCALEKNNFSVYFPILSTTSSSPR